jgi:hypothetical protein
MKTETTTLTVEVSQDLQGTTRRLIDLAARGLVPMFDERAGLFCYKLNGEGEGLVREGLSPRYTAMCLMGLKRLEQSGVKSPIETQPVLEGLLSKTEWADNIGDMGVLVWLCSQLAPERLNELDTRIGVRHALYRLADVSKGQTMELAWFLTGLSYWGLARPEMLGELRELAFDVFGRLKNNQGKHGIFGHASRKGSLAGRTRGWIGSFADQVYPIYGMALFSRVFGNREAEARALQCGRAICEAQGKNGQWWWHYDSSTGHVIDGYPVFSVHQHAMAPMTLFMLGDVVGHDFSPWIYRGLEWINGNNELGFDMENGTARLVWRCIYRASARFTRYLNAAFDHARAEVTESGNSLKVLFECRPYELGWLLYAFAGRAADHVPTKRSESVRSVAQGVA